MKCTFTLIVLLCFCRAYPQLQGNYATGEQKFRIDTLNGLYHGRVTLWDKDGKKKLEGQYKNNQRTGKWTIWDSLGQVRIKIDYKDSYRFTLLKMNNSEGKPIKRSGLKEHLQQRYLDSLERDKWRFAKDISKRPDTIKPYVDRTIPQKSLGYEDYPLKRDNEGVFNYPQVGDQELLLTRKQYRFLEPEKANMFLFEDGLLLKAIENHISDTPSPEVYTTLEFTVKMPKEEALAKIKDVSIAGYKMVEIYYFDRRYYNSSLRILGVTPVVFNSSTNHYDELFTIFYPAPRNKLGEVKISFADNPDIQTLEDALHFRRFSSFLYFQEHATKKESDVAIYSDAKRLKAESAELEGMLLNYDWGSWLYLTK